MYSDDERSGAAIAQRQAQSLLIFVRHALAALSLSSFPKESSSKLLTSEILHLLLELGNHQPGEELDDVTKTARSSVLNALGIMSASEFVGGTLVILQ